MSNIRSLGRFRLALLATILLLGTVLAVGSLFAANDRANPEIQPAVQSAHFDGVDPGLDAKPPVAERVESQPGDGTDPGAGQEVEESGGIGTLSQWLSDRPDGIEHLSPLDAIKADEIDLEWMLYQAVQKNTMTEEEADSFRAWFAERPSVEEALDQLQQQPGTYYYPGDGESNSGTSGGFKAY